MHDVVLRNGRLVDPGPGRDEVVDVAFADGKVAEIASVIASGAGPPLPMLYLMPKSPSGPPGLCEADSMIPP